MKKEKVLGTKRWFYWVSIGVVLIIIYKLLDNFSGIGNWFSNLFSVLAPFLEGILIAYILYIPCKKIEEILSKTKIKFLVKHARGTSITLTYIILLVSIALFMNVIIPILASSISDLISNVQNYYNSVVSDSPDLTITPFIQENILKPVVDWIQNIDFESLFTFDMIKEYLSSAMGFIKGVINLFIAIICSVYILAQRTRIINFLNRFARAVLTERGYQRFNRYFTSGNNYRHINKCCYEYNGSKIRCVTWNIDRYFKFNTILWRNIWSRNINNNYFTYRWMATSLSNGNCGNYITTN